MGMTEEPEGLEEQGWEQLANLTPEKLAAFVRLAEMIREAGANFHISYGNLCLNTRAPRAAPLAVRYRTWVHAGSGIEVHEYYGFSSLNEVAETVGGDVSGLAELSVSEVGLVHHFIAWLELLKHTCLIDGGLVVLTDAGGLAMRMSTMREVVAHLYDTPRDDEELGEVTARRCHDVLPLPPVLSVAA